MDSVHTCWFTDNHLGTSPISTAILCTVSHRDHLRFQKAEADTACAVWVRWINLLTEVEAVVIRFRGSVNTVTQVLDEIDLYHYHPSRAAHVYGMTTIHESQARDQAHLVSVLQSPDVTSDLSDWDVRWSDLRLNMGDEMTQLIGTSRSHYLVRTESVRTLNRLQVSLNLDDPQDSRFRSAKRILGSHFGEALSRDTAWEFEGPSLGTADGRLYRQLQDALESLVHDINESGAEISPAPKAGLGELIPLGGGGLLEGQALIDRFGDAISKALPGFRFDRRAHVTEKYFLEFVKRTAGGFHLIEIQRYYRPAGFSVRIAASQFRIPINDLVPVTGCAVPGIVLPLEHLASERSSRWSYKRSRMFERALEDFSTILERRVRPFFERADILLQDHNATQQEIQ